MITVSGKISYVLSYYDEDANGKLEITSNKEIIAKRAIEILGSLEEKSRAVLRLFMEEDIFPSSAHVVHNRLELYSKEENHKSLYIYRADNLTNER